MTSGSVSGKFELKGLDVVVFEGRWWNPLELPVMWRSMSRHSHCVLCHPTMPHRVIDPDLSGLRTSSIFNYGGRRFKVCRYNRPLDRHKMSNWLQTKLINAQGYDYLAWLGFATGLKMFEDEDRWFCSELPYWMFQENGCVLTREPLTFVFPEFFVEHPYFDTVYEGIMP